MWEEPGWSGFALPRLQERYAGRRLGLLKVSLMLGALRAAWHILLAISGAIPWYDVLFFEMAFQLLISWLYNRTEAVSRYGALELGEAPCRIDIGARPGAGLTSGPALGPSKNG